jgi:hypothetical protein
MCSSSLEFWPQEYLTVFAVPEFIFFLFADTGTLSLRTPVHISDNNSLQPVTFFDFLQCACLQQLIHFFGYGPGSYFVRLTECVQHGTGTALFY